MARSPLSLSGSIASRPPEGTNAAVILNVRTAGDKSDAASRRHLPEACGGAPAGRNAALYAKVGPPQGAAEAAERAVVRLEHIGKRYDAAEPVLTDVSLALDPGGFTFLTGAEGAGKSTLLKIVYLAEWPSRGRLRLFGSDPAALDRRARAALRRRIGIVFQDLRLIGALSARDNAALPLRIAGVPEARIRDDVAELLAWVGLAHRADAPAATLSGGERRRLAVARAIVGRPELLIADEPTGSLDAESAHLLVHALEQVSRLGATVLIATQDIAFARQFGHRRFHLAKGTLAEPERAAVA
jgi:cell division transport system ATP-binding protein